MFSGMIFVDDFVFRVMISVFRVVFRFSLLRFSFLLNLTGVGYVCPRPGPYSKLVSAMLVLCSNGVFGLFLAFHCLDPSVFWVFTNLIRVTGTNYDFC